MVQGVNETAAHEVIAAIEFQLTHMRIDEWLHHDLFAWQWWLMLAVLIIPWFFWWKKVDRTRLMEIILLGMMVFIISSYLDAVLSELGLWVYHYWIIPLWPRLIAADWSVLPLTYMFIYQKYGSSWRVFITAMTITSALYSFVGESFLIWIGVYELHGWQHYYSFPIYLGIGVLVKWLTGLMKSSQEQTRAG